MRKITLNPRIGDQYPTTVDWKNDWVVIKENDQIKEFSAPKKDDEYLEYTKEQQEVIRTVNRVLEHNDQPAMSVDEADFLIFPFGKDQKVEVKDLQTLAGFKVEKKIVPMDKEK